MRRDGAGRHQRQAASHHGLDDPQDQKSELYGRCIVILAAEQYASRLVVPSSQQHRPMRWGSHKDRARKALAKLAGPHLPGSLKQLERAVAKAKVEYDQATRRATPAVAAASEASVGDPEDRTTAGEPAHEEEGLSENEDLVEPDEHELTTDGLVDVAGAVEPGRL